MSQDLLKELRGKVDVINLQLLELLNQRARVVSEIGKVNSNLGNPFYDPVREGEMLLVTPRRAKVFLDQAAGI